MIVERVEHPSWTSNTYLVSDGTTGVIAAAPKVHESILELAVDANADG